VPDAAQLRLLVTDAADRAAALLAGTHPAGNDRAEAQPAEDGQADVDVALIDAIRLLASTAGISHTARAARLTGQAEDELRRLVLAYRHGGSGGTAAAIGPSAADPDQLENAVRDVRARRSFAVGDLQAGPGGVVTDPCARVQIRLGPDQRWYPFTAAQDRWWPAPGAAGSPGGAYQAALRTRSLRR
jgi:hypothetical protein